ncbi:Pentatricopeptide repeat-containing protein [Musa troglodytarum]|uniref:Pentatricopeptide repeat-containing protein n=3 Tax=Musa troglodytarum TaxID=320322 RepID=A0A9E7H5T8_9LILI|nr:Pentatricopeptide repeat-containing protein [Musa troglodytarum]
MHLRAPSLRHLKRAHARLLKLDPSLSSSAAATLLSLYPLAAHGGASYAKSLFSQFLRPSVLHWNTLIRGLSSGENPHEAIHVFRSMLRGGSLPNNFTYPFLLKACAACASEPYGCAAHARIVKTGLELDPYIQSALIHAYSECKDLGAARRLLDQCDDRETVCCNAMVDGYVKAGELALARGVFDRMERKDVVSWNTMINGCAILGDLSEARKLFAGMPQRNVVSWNSMLAAHAKCGDVEGARRVFAEMPKRDIISWNTMLACLAQSGCSEEALALFDGMRRTDEKPTDATMVSLLSACAHSGALDQGEQLHAYMEEHKIKLNTILSTALVDMYAKCGSISRAAEIFYAIEQKDLLAWNAIIGGMAIHGRADEALQLFDEMTKSGVRPDDITFVMVLTACSHAGMVKAGRRMLNCMKDSHGIDPKLEHYGCVIDLLARAGLFEEAAELTRAMPMEPSAPALGALLGGCRIHRNSEVADGVGGHLLHLQPGHSGRYVLLSNIYATAGRWDDAKEVRGRMLMNGVAKTPGMSMIEPNGTPSSASS